MPEWIQSLFYQRSDGKVMGFMESYKHLDNLCKDMNGIGVTGYIKDMEQEQNGGFYVAGWKNDYKKLKHYRYIRNQIAHENYADENNLCTAGDKIWLDGFYQRIMEQTDPLALCYKETKLRSSSKFTKTKNSPATQDILFHEQPRQTKKNSGICLMLLLIVVVFIVLILCLLR